jgi:hypothetical protein
MQRQKASKWAPKIIAMMMIAMITTAMMMKTRAAQHRSKSFPFHTRFDSKTIIAQFLHFLLSLQAPD